MSGRTATDEAMSQLRHSLRTPLNHIIGYAEILLEDGSGLDTAASLERILCLARSACDLIGSTGSQVEERFDSEQSQELLVQKARALAGEAAALQSENVRDLERIRGAAHELLNLAVGGTRGEAKSETAPARLHNRADLQPANGRLLIVDDDEMNRDLLRRHLRKQGYETEVAENGARALQRLRLGGIDLVLLDLVMPGMDGLDVLDEIRRDRDLGEIPVLMVSAADDLHAIAESIQRGAEDYLFKPFDSTLLDARLRATLERKRLRDHERTRNMELERVTAALQRSNDDLQRFAYAASHDLQAPVRTITTYLQLLQRRVGARLSVDEIEMIGFAQGAAKRMHDLIQDLLSYSRASTGQLATEHVNTEELLRTLLGDMRVMLEEAGARVVWSSLPAIVADPTGLRQLFQNLITNAIKYGRAEEPAKIHISASQDQDGWRFSVRDNGQGIPAEYTRQIFLMFKRLHGDDIPGSGIGLSICQRIVERLGGKIWVDSEAGHGSTFFFTIPFADAIA